MSFVCYFKTTKDIKNNFARRLIFKSLLDQAVFYFAAILSDGHCDLLEVSHGTTVSMDVMHCFFACALVKNTILYLFIDMQECMTALLCSLLISQLFEDFMNDIRNEYISFDLHRIALQV